MNILLIDKRVQDYETIIAAIDPAFAVGIVFDYYEDTFDTVKARIGALGLTNGTTQISVGLIQHNYRAPMFTMLASADVAPIAQVESQDPELERWTQFRDFITWCKTTPEINAAHFDMMACALYSDPDWKYVIDTLTTQTGVTVRASTDDTGSASLGGDWFLESHTGINLKTVYFTEAIEAYRGVLYTYPIGIGNNRNYMTKGFATGSVIPWGDIQRGGWSQFNGAPNPETSGFVAVYSTIHSFAALKTDGSVFVWGDGVGSAPSTVTGANSGVIAIYSTENAFAALKSDGSVVSWGSNSTAPSSVTDANSGVVVICSNTDAFAALKSNGSVVAWGSSESGGTTAPSSVTAANSGVVAIYYSVKGFVALKSNGSVVVWGYVYNAYPAQVLTAPNSVTAANSGVVVVYSNDYAFAALKSDGTLVAWGNVEYGGAAPTSVTDANSGVVAVYSTLYAFAALKSDGSVVAWGPSWSPASAAPSSVTAANSGVVSIYSSIASGRFTVLKSDGSIVTWGDSAAPSSVTTANSSVVSVYTGNGSAAALKSNGSLVVWGSSYGGGNSSSVSSSLTSGVIAVYPTLYALAALKSDGRIVAWGESSVDYGRTAPSSVTAANSGVVAVYSVNNAFAALKSSATTFDLSMSYYTYADRFNILRKKENRRRVNLTTLNNNVFTLSAASDIQAINPNIPTGKILRIIVPDYVSSSSYSITSTATIPSGSGNFIVACDESEPVTISGTTYVNYGTFVYRRETNNTFTKTTSATINGTSYTLYGGDGINSSGIVLLEVILEVSTFSSATFMVESSKTFGDASFAIVTRPTSNSPGAITYSSSNTAVATIDASGNWITLVAAGDVSFNATQAATAQYAAATKTSNTLTVARGTTTLARTAMDAALSKTFGIDISFNVVATSESSGAVTYTSSAPQVATVGLSTGLVTPVSAGQTTITAQQAQSAQYNVPTSITSVLTVSRGTTSLTSFSVDGSKTFGDVPFSLTTTPTSDSSGAITYSSNATGVATINASSGIITLVAGGTATFTAAQAESAQYNAPTPVTSNTLTVSKGTPTLAFVSPPTTKSITDAAFTVVASSASSGAVTYTSSNTAVATVGSTTGLVTPLDTGSVTITAAQASTAQYNAPTNTTCAIAIGAAADLSGTTVTISLANKNLTGISLVNTDLTNVSLSGANLSNANITGASFINTDISGATNLPVFSTTQKLQLLRNANNAAVSAIQISTPLSGAEINAAITTPIPDISGATFVVKAPAYNVNNEKVVTITAEDMANDESLYIPMNSNETVKVNGVAYTFNGTNILNSSGSVIQFINVLGKPFRLYAGSIVGLNVSDQLSNIKLNGDGLYDILTGLFAAKS